MTGSHDRIATLRRQGRQRIIVDFLDKVAAERDCSPGVDVHSSIEEFDGGNLVCWRRWSIDSCMMYCPAQMGSDRAARRLEGGERTSAVDESVKGLVRLAERSDQFPYRGIVGHIQSSKDNVRFTLGELFDLLTQ